MSAKLEKSVVLLLLVILFVVMANTFFLQGFSLTKEEAMEISRRSDTVQWYMDRVVSYSVEAYYWNSTNVNQVREEFPYLQEQYPENRSVWTVVWNIHTYLHANTSSSTIVHVIDDETGQIVYESQIGQR